MRNLRTILFYCITTTRAFQIFGQENPNFHENIIPNPDFEQFNHSPIGWYYNGEIFTALVKDWSSPTTASPDWYHPAVKIPESWESKGFGALHPKAGRAMVGITVFGCGHGKPHCREYIQVALTEPLVPGQRYRLSVWLAPLPNGLRTSRLGVYLSKSRTYIKTDHILDLSPIREFQRVIECETWCNVFLEFEAIEASRFLIVGNFGSDQETVFLAGDSTRYGFGYYYIDQISLRKVPPFLTVPQDELEDWYPLEEGKIILLRDIYFDFDKIELTGPARQELTRLINLLKTYPEMVVEIRGHTDSVGGLEYNMNLSRRRAMAVLHYIVDGDITQSRLKPIGFGPMQPVSDNQSTHGRKLNRRVEFRILRN